MFLTGEKTDSWKKYEFMKALIKKIETIVIEFIISVQT